MGFIRVVSKGGARLSRTTFHILAIRVAMQNQHDTMLRRCDLRQGGAAKKPPGVSLGGFGAAHACGARCAGARS
jgi:hypothetical protein